MVQGSMELAHILAGNIVRLRKERGWSQDVLAYEARVSRRYMARIESGDAAVGLGVLEKLASRLGVHAYELLKPPKGKAQK